jgi:hypothetical protein
VTGEHVLAVGTGEGLIEGDEPVRITGPSRVEVDYRDNSGARVAGGLLLFGGTAGGVGLLCAGVVESNNGNPSESSEATLVGLGVGLIVVGALFGGSMLTMKDGVAFHVTPLTPAPLAGREGAPSAALPQGLALTGTF